MSTRSKDEIKAYIDGFSEGLKIGLMIPFKTHAKEMRGIITPDDFSVLLDELEKEKRRVGLQ